MAEQERGCFFKCRGGYCNLAYAINSQMEHLSELTETQRKILDLSIENARLTLDEGMCELPKELTDVLAKCRVENHE